MAVMIKCKMCGGDLLLIEGSTIATCEYCGTTQTVPSQDNEKKLAQFARANQYRSECEFDKAAGVYESIIADFPGEAEAYWGLVLCKYGIEYVDDPATGKKIPTCHRSSFDTVMEDKDFEQVLDTADVTARKVYREEARQIEQIRKGILEVSAKEDPYDIFICYKETDENGERTVDSVLAQNLYNALTEKGYRVFFSRISLEDKLGQEYEPYIFAALNSAKVMLAIGTDYEHFNAVWVKNEWSRYLKLIGKGEKKTLIPCYKGIDAYDMPKEFRALQAQDLGKVGAEQDLLRGVDKILAITKKEQTVSAGGSNLIEETLARAYAFLNEADWEAVKKCLETVLGYDPHNVSALIGCLMLELRVTQENNLSGSKTVLEKTKYYPHVMRYADDAVKARLEGYNKDTIYAEAMTKASVASADSVEAAIRLLQKLGTWKDAQSQIEALQKKLDAIKQKNRVFAKRASIVAIAAILLLSLLYIKKTYLDPRLAYNKAVALMEKGEYAEAVATFEALGDYRDSSEKTQESKARNAELQLEIEYQNAVALMETGQYQEALVIFQKHTDYKDSAERIPECKYRQATAWMEAGEYEKALNTFQNNANYKDSTQKIAECKYRQAMDLMEAGEYEKALTTFQDYAHYYEDGEEKIKEIKYQKATALGNAGEAYEAKEIFEALGDYKDSAAMSVAVVQDALNAAAVGDKVKFGQHLDSLEWIVIKKESDRMLLLCNSYTGKSKFHYSNTAITWENSDIRKWLNTSFYKSMFSSTEEALILTATVPADPNPLFATDAGNDTQDKVFLLSLSEAMECPEKRFVDNNDRAVAWLLRTPGKTSNTCANVYTTGTVNAEGNEVNQQLSIRPAIWVKVSE